MKIWIYLLIGLCILSLMTACRIVSFAANSAVPTASDTKAPTRTRITRQPTRTRAPTATPRPVTPTPTPAPTDTPRPTETTITREHAWQILFRGHSCYGSSECGPAWTDENDSNFLIWSSDPGDPTDTDSIVPFPTPPVSPDGRYQALVRHMEGLYIKDLSTQREELVYPVLWGENDTHMWIGPFCWLPESQTLIFAENGTINIKPADTKILSIQADGGGLETLAILPGDVFGHITSGGACSPDGEWVIFSEQSELPGIYGFNIITRDVVIILQNYFVNYLTVLPRAP